MSKFSLGGRTVLQLPPPGTGTSGGFIKGCPSRGSGETSSRALHGDREGGHHADFHMNLGTSQAWLPGTLNMLEGYSTEGQAPRAHRDSFQGSRKGNEGDEGGEDS